MSAFAARVREPGLPNRFDGSGNMMGFLEP
jgi:hypothetical protein